MSICKYRKGPRRNVKGRMQDVVMEMKWGMKFVQAAKQQCFHGTGGMLGKQGEMGNKSVFCKSLSLF